jgi:hypothetical protein
MLHPSSCKLLNKNIFVSAILLTPAVVFAEVSDKEPSLCFVWTLGIIAALVCFAATFFLKWYGTIVAVFPLFWFVLHFIELHFDDVGMFLYIEQGAAYFIQSYLAASLVLLATLAGFFVGKKRRG